MPPMDADLAPHDRRPGSAVGERDQLLREEAAAVAAFEQAQRPTRVGGMTIEESLKRWAAETTLPVRCPRPVHRR